MEVKADRRLKVPIDQQWQDKARCDVTGKKVSEQQVLVMAEFTSAPQQWREGRDIEHKTGVPGSTVRHLLLTLSTLGILDRSEMFGGYRYRLSPAAQAQPYFQRVQEATAMMRA